MDCRILAIFFFFLKPGRSFEPQQLQPLFWEDTQAHCGDRSPRCLSISGLTGTAQEGKPKMFTGRSGFMGINNSLEAGWTLAVSCVPEKSPSFYPYRAGTWGPIPGKLDASRTVCTCSVLPLTCLGHQLLSVCWLGPALAHQAIFLGPAVPCSVLLMRRFE